MKYKVLLLLVAVVVVALVVGVSFLAFGSGPEVLTGDTVTVTIHHDGHLSLDGDDGHFPYYKGATVEMKYLIVNESDEQASPEFYLRLADIAERLEEYSRSKGKYVAVPNYYRDWFTLPTVGVIEPGMSKGYIVVLHIPEDTQEVIPEHWAFKVGVDPEIQAVEIPVATWWRVDMR